MVKEREKAQMRNGAIKLELITWERGYELEQI
jgi:hypothetical protein